MRGAPANTREALARAHAWAAGEGIEGVVVSRAHLLTRQPLEELVTFAALLGAELWIVAQRALTREQRAMLRDWPYEARSFAELAQRFPPTGKAPSGAAPAPHIPDSEFPTFLHDCRRLLGELDYERVSSRFVGSEVATQKWIAKTSEAKGGIDAAAIETFVSGLVHRSHELSDALVLLRGAQVVLFRHGWLVKGNTDTLAGGYAGGRLASLTPQTAAALRRYSHPGYASIATVSLVTRARPSQLVALNIVDLSEDGAEVSVAGEAYSVPYFARGILLAHRAWRYAGGAAETDALFVAEKRRDRAPGRLVGHGAQQQLRWIAQETGLSLIRRDPTRPGSRLAATRGLSAHALGGEA
jgi:hypothetical protein